MSELSNFRDAEDKLRALCDENDLDYVINFDRYPLKLTIRPADEAQMSVFTDQPEGGQAPVFLTFCFVGGELQYYTKRLSISEQLFNKIKNLYRKMHFAYLQYFHHQVVVNGLLPEIAHFAPSADALDATEIEGNGEDEGASEE